jgi:glutamate/tyrosine decarboxylase-like PLP-dependent enzyme
MADPIDEQSQTLAALELVTSAAGPYLDALATRPVRDAGALDLLEQLGGPLPDDGDGTMAAVRRLLEVGTEAAVHSSGPRFFALVVGGATPAAQAADWVTTLLDQAAGLWISSPLAATVETTALNWLKELLGLPVTHGGLLTPSATHGNLAGLACARSWWGRQHGVDVMADGLAGLPAMPVVSGGHTHVSCRKALQLLGCGRNSVRTFARDDTGAADLDAIDRALSELDEPAVVIGTAGEVNAGDFDPLDALADLAERHGAWFHVDGAFGAYAAASPRTAHLTRGMERADSLAADGHKWLNVPYESGFVLVRDPQVLGKTFGGAGAAYLPPADDPHPSYSMHGPALSQRARALPIWATLRAYGKRGHQAMIDRHLELAQHLGQVVDEADEFELLAPVRLSVVCFRYRPAGVPEADLDALNQRLGAALIEDGRVYAGTTTYRGMTALRPAMVNWRTTEPDVDLLVSVLRELGPGLIRSTTR